MINSVEVFDLSEAVSCSYKDTKHNAWISTVDQEDENKVRSMKANFAKKGVPHFAQYFYDWSDEDSIEWQHLADQGPQKSHVNTIISFLKPIVSSDKPFNIGINCYAGVSRSTAIAIIAWVMQGLTPEKALDAVLKVRPQAWPNLRMLRFASERLGVDIFTPISQWKAKYKTRLYTGGNSF